MKTGILRPLGMLLLFCPTLTWAQIPTHGSLTATPAHTPTNTPTFTLKPSPFFTFTQTPSPTPAMTADNTPAAPLTTATPTGEKSRMNEILDAQAEITDLTDKRSDTDLQLRHLERVYLEDLMRSQAKAAPRAAKARKAKEIQKQITEMEALRDSEWDQDAVILEKRSHLKQLQLDSGKEINEMLLEKARESGNSKRVEELENGKQALDQMKDMENQDLDLRKQLLQARRNYDFKAAADLRQKLKDLQTKYRDLLKQAADKLKQIQGTREPDELNL
jgi:hypothetical protein